MNDKTNEKLQKLVVVAIVIKDNKILMVERQKVEGDLCWQFPAGKVENKEKENEAVERETFEESNIKCKAISKLGERIHPDTNRIISYWVCEYISGEARVNDIDEIRSAEWVEIEQIFMKITTDLYLPVREYILGINKKSADNCNK